METRNNQSKTSNKKSKIINNLNFIIMKKIFISLMLIMGFLNMSKGQSSLNASLQTGAEICAGDSISLNLSHEIGDTINGDTLNAFYVYYTINGNPDTAYTATITSSAIAGNYVIDSVIFHFNHKSDTIIIDTTISVHPLPSITVNITNAKCFYDTMGYINVLSNSIGQNDIIGEDYSWKNNPNTNTLSVFPYSYTFGYDFPVGNDTMIVTATYNNYHNCSITKPVEVKKPDTIKINNVSTTPQTICDPHGNGSIAFSVVGGTGQYNVIHNVLQDTVQTISNYTIENLSATLHPITVTDSNNCSIDTTIEVLSNLVGVDSIAHTDNICYGDSIGTITVYINGGVSPYTVFCNNDSIITNTNIVTFDSLTAGEYTIYVRDTNGCLTTQYVDIVSENPRWTPVVSSQITDVSCDRSNMGSISVIAENATCYSWSTNANFAWGFTDTTGVCLSADTGYHYLYVMDSNGCVADTVYSFFVDQDTIPVILATADLDTICAGDTVTFTATGGDYYVWYCGNDSIGTGDSISIQIDSTCSIMAEGFGNGGCSSIDTINIVVNPLPTVTENLNFHVCANTNISTSYAINAFNYDSNISYDTTATTFEIIGNTLNVYAEFTNQYGCRNRDTAQIQLQNVIIPSNFVDSITICRNNINEIQNIIDSTISQYTNDYDSVTTIRIDHSDFCDIEYTFNIGTCSEDVTQHIFIREELAIDSINASNPLCFGDNNGTISVYTNRNTVNYEWNDDSTVDTSFRVGLTIGTYNVTISDNDAVCSIDTTVTLTQPDSLQVFAYTEKDFDCTPGIASVSVIGGTTPYQLDNYPNIEWRDTLGNTTYCVIDNLNIGQYTFTVSDSNGCPTQANMITIDDNNLVTTINSSNLSCYNVNSGTITVNVTHGNAPYIIICDNDSVNANSYTFDSLDAGAHVITVIDSLGCQKSDTVILTQPNAITIQSSNITHEYCGMLGSISIVAVGGTGTALNYHWDNDSIGQIITNLPGDSTYTITITDQNGCTTSVGFYVDIEPMPFLVFDDTLAPSCYNGNDGRARVTIVCNNPIYSTYLWDNGETSANNYTLSSGYHTVTVSDSRGCVLTDTVLIPSVEPIQIYLSGRNANCNFGGLIQIDSINGGTAPYNVIWNDNSTSNIITSPAQNTPYIVTVRDDHNCTATDTISIGLDSSPHIDSVITSPANCYGDSNGSAQAFVTGGTGQLTYVWEPSPIQSIYNTADNLSAGDYMIVVSDTNQCRDTMTFTIEQPDQLTVIYTKDDVNCDATILGFIDIDTITGGTPNYWHYLNGNDQTGYYLMDSLVSGNYILEIVDDHGCSITENINIGQYPTPTISAHLISNVLCNGGDNGSAYVYTNASNPIILWNESYEQTDTATHLQAGINTVTVTDDHNCVVSASVQVTEPQAITSIITTYITNCTEGNAVVTAFGGTDTLMFEWSNGYTTNQISNITIGAPYYVAITDGNGCTKVDSAIVYLPQNPLAVNITAESILCNGGFANATANATGGYGNYSYYWDNQTTNSQNWPLNAGIHTVTVIDVNGCSATSNITMSEPDAISFDTAIISNAHCNSTTGSICLNVSGGTQPFNYAWSGYPYNTCCPTGMNPGTYTVTVTDGNNCTATNTYTIGIDPTPTATATLLSDVLCHGDHTGSALVTTNVLNPTIVWNESQEQTAIATQLGAGINTVTVMDIYGCTATATVQINEPQAITTTVNTYMTNCSIGNAIVNATGGTGLLSYNWGNGNTTNQISNLTIGALYTVTITDENGCTKIDSVTVYLPQNPLTVSITPENILCNGGFANTTANATGGSGTYVSYIWDNQTTSTQTAMLQAGTHTVTVIDGNGCSATANITMAEPDAIVFGQAIVTNANCNSATGSICVQVSGSTQPFNYSWNNYPYNTCCPTGMNPGSYTVTVTDANGCTATNNYTIGIDPAPVASITTSNTHICAGDLVNISATGGTFYQWNTGSNASTVSMTLTSPMTFVVTVTDVHGCSDTASVYIDVHQQPTLSFNLIDDICYDDNIVDLSQYCNPNYGVVFDGVGVSGNYFYPVNAVGGNMPITATYTDANGCSVSVMESIYVHPMPNATWNAEFPNMCINSQPIQLTGGIPAGGIYTGDGVTNGYFDPAQAGVGLKHIYYVYTDQYGCDIVLNKTITVSNIQNIAWYPESDYYQCGNPSILTVFPDGGEMKVDGWSIAHYNGNPGMFILHPDDYSIGTHVLSYELNNGCAANASVPIYIHPCNNNTGIEDEESSSISLFPNPTKSNITIRWDEQQNIEIIQLFNTVGKKINELTANGNSVEINLSELPNSIYFVRLVSKDGGFTTHKVIKE